MKGFLAIFKKEFKSYFNSPIAYVFLTIYLAFTNWLFFKTFFISGFVTMRPYFGILPIVFLFFVPAITMRLWAEEKKSGTIELLFTLPLSSIQIVMGKYLASLMFLTITLMASFSVPLSLATLGDLEMGPVVGAYFGAFFMGGAYLAIGMFISSLTENQIIAFIMGVVVTFFFYIIGSPLVAFSLPNFLVPIFSFLGLATHYESIGKGVIDTRDLLYYFSLIGFFLFLNIFFINNRKWKNG